MFMVSLSLIITSLFTIITLSHYHLNRKSETDPNARLKILEKWASALLQVITISVCWRWASIFAWMDVAFGRRDSAAVFLEFI